MRATLFTNELLMERNGRATRADECLLLGAKRTWTNRYLPNSIYEYTALDFSGDARLK